MVASKGGITLDRAEEMTVRQVRDYSLALAIAHGSDIDWDTGAVIPAKESGDRHDESDRFGRA